MLSEAKTLLMVELSCCAASAEELATDWRSVKSKAFLVADLRTGGPAVLVHALDSSRPVREAGSPHGQHGILATIGGDVRGTRSQPVQPAIECLAPTLDAIAVLSVSLRTQSADLHSSEKPRLEQMPTGSGYQRIVPQ